tara:strand:- start:257 stop:382 length:126 start_codon:yes stop_codon:yes gene_type:complete
MMMMMMMMMMIIIIIESQKRFSLSDNPPRALSRPWSFWANT